QAAATKVGNKAVNDAYQGLKALLRRKHKGKSSDRTLLDKGTKRSSAENARLKTALEKSDVENDPKVVEAAQKLMTLIDPKNAATGKYSLQVTGDVHGVVQGDNAQVSMTFGSEPNNTKK
ncbi:MAG TPA: hypothetical protein VFA15_04810, partial [Nitrososphaera sp.]|nr:hypothetical protein [Nitrososphaera sp.]